MEQQTPRYSGKKIREILRAQGRHQRWFAKQLGWSEAYVSYMLHDKRPVPSAVAEHAARILQVPVSFFESELSVDSRTLSDRSEADHVAD